MHNERPVNLDLTTIKLPVPAYTSILHRITGILLLFGIGLLLYFLQQSLHSPESFEALKQVLLHPVDKFLLWATVSALLFHLVAGIKHLLMDINIGDGKRSGTIGAVLTLLLSTVLIVLAGVWLW